MIFSSFVLNPNIEAELLVPEAKLSSDSLRPETRKVIRIIFIDLETLRPSKDSFIYPIWNDFRFIANAYHERFIQNTEDEGASSERGALLPRHR